MSEFGNVNFNNSKLTSTNTENKYQKQERQQNQSKRQQQEPKSNSGSLQDEAMANLLETISRNQRDDDLLERNKQQYLINRERNLQSSKDYLNHVQEIRENQAKQTQQENESIQEANIEYKTRLQEISKTQINTLLKKPIYSQDQTTVTQNDQNAVNLKLNKPTLSSAQAANETVQQQSASPALDKALNKIKNRLNIQTSAADSLKAVPEFHVIEKSSAKAINTNQTSFDAATIHPDLEQVQASIERAKEWSGKQEIHIFKPLQPNEIQQYLLQENLEADYKSVQMIKSASDTLQRSDQFFMKAASFLRSINFPLEADIIFRVMRSFDVFEAYQRPVTLRKLEKYILLKQQELINQEAKLQTEAYFNQMKGLDGAKANESLVLHHTPLTANLAEGRTRVNQTQAGTSQAAQSSNQKNSALYADVSVHDLNIEEAKLTEKSPTIPPQNKMDLEFESKVRQLLKENNLNTNRMMLEQLYHMSKGELTTVRAIILLLKNNQSLDPVKIKQLSDQFASLNPTTTPTSKEKTTPVSIEQAARDFTLRNLPPTILMRFYGDREQTRKTTEKIFHLLNESSFNAKTGFILIHQLLSLFDLSDAEKDRLAQIMRQASPELPQRLSQLVSPLRPLLGQLVYKGELAPLKIHHSIFQAICAHLEEGIGLPGLKQIVQRYQAHMADPTLVDSEPDLPFSPPPEAKVKPQPQILTVIQPPESSRPVLTEKTTPVLSTASMAAPTHTDTPEGLQKSTLTMEEVLKRFYPKHPELAQSLNQQISALKEPFIQLHQWLAGSQFMPQLQQLVTKVNLEKLMERLIHLKDLLPHLSSDEPVSEKVTSLLTYLERGGSPKTLEKALTRQNTTVKPLEVSYNLQSLFQQAINTSQPHVQQGINHLQQLLEYLPQPDTLLQTLTQLAQSSPGTLTQQLSQLSPLVLPILQHLQTTPSKQLSDEIQQSLNQNLLQFFKPNAQSAPLTQLMQPIVEEPALSPEQYIQVYERLKQAGLNIQDVSLLKHIWQLSNGSLDSVDAIAVLLHGNLPLERSNIQVVTQYIQKLPPGQRFTSISKILTYLSDHLVSLINHQLKNPLSQSQQSVGQQQLLENLFNQRGQQLTPKAQATSEQVLKQFKSVFTEATIEGMGYLLQSQMAKTPQNLTRIQAILTNHLSPSQMLYPLQHATEHMLLQLNQLIVPPQQKAILQSAIQLMQALQNYFQEVHHLLSPTVQNLGTWALALNGSLKKLDERFQKELKSLEKALASSLGQGISKDKGWLGRIQGYLASLGQWAQQLQSNQDLSAIQRHMSTELANLRTELEGLALFLHQDSDTLEEWMQYAAEQKGGQPPTSMEVQQMVVPTFLQDLQYPTEISVREEPDPDGSQPGDKRLVINLLVQTHTLGQILLRFNLGKKGLQLRLGLEQASIRDWLQPYLEQLQEKMSQLPFKIDSLQTYVVSSLDQHQNLIARQIHSRYRRSAIEPL